VLSFSQLEDVQRCREAPTFLFSGAYVAARRRHTLMMLTRQRTALLALLSNFESGEEWVDLGETLGELLGNWRVRKEGARLFSA
jgi:hypothetical protein